MLMSLHRCCFPEGIVVMRVTVPVNVIMFTVTVVIVIPVVVPLLVAPADANLSVKDDLDDFADVAVIELGMLNKRYLGE